VATCSLFGSPYECPDASGGGNQWGNYDFSAWEHWQVGDPTPSGVQPPAAQGGPAPTAGDIVAIGSGLVGLVLSIVQGVAQVESQTGQQVEHQAAQLPVMPPPAAPAAPTTDWMPIAIGGGLLLVLMMGMRR